MNKTILRVTIMAGIAVMLSMSVMPASANPPDNVCVGSEKIGITCTKEPAVGQHALLNLESIENIRENYPTGGCHYDISEITIFGIELWVFNLVEGPNKCQDSFGISKSAVNVVGN